MSGRRLLTVTGVAALLVLVVGAAVELTGSAQSMAAGQGGVAAAPTTRVTRGSMALDVYMTGELRATQQSAITAPSVGGTLRILSVVPTGSVVDKGDVIMAFDPADQQYALEQAESQLLEAEQEIAKQKADAETQIAQDKVTLLTAQFDVRRAELDAAVDQDLVAVNDYQIRQVTLEEAKRRLTQVEQDVGRRQTTTRAALTVLEEKRNAQKLAADRARQNMEMLSITAPMNGVVVVRENLDAAGGVIFSGMTLPPLHVGDSVYSGRPVLDVFDVSNMEIRATVNEQERANVAVGQTASVDADSLTGPPLEARVNAVSGLGKVDRMNPLRLFDVTLDLVRPDPRLRPGTSVHLVAHGPKVDDVLMLPRQAVFEQDGKPIVYVRGDAGAFEPKPVKILHRNETTVAVDDIAAGTEVALVNPDARPNTGGGAAGPSAVIK